MTDTRLRSLLFAPATRADVMAKLPRSGPDGVVLDLEDAVPASGKGEARRRAAEAAAALRAEHDHLAIYLRVNAVPTEWFADDLASVTDVLTGVVVPKVERVAQVERVVEGLAARALAGLDILAGIETVAGVVAAREILAHSGVGSCYFGAEDYIADLGGVRTEGNLEVLYARSEVAMAARLAGAHALDQVVTQLRDEARFRADAAQGRSLGYQGKLCVHPAQVPWANEAFSPTPEEIERARRLVRTYDAAVARGESSIAFEGQMIDEPLARQARAVLSGADPRG